MAAILLLLLIAPSGWAAAVIAGASAPLLFKCIWGAGLLVMVASLTVYLLPKTSLAASARTPMSTRAQKQHIARAYVRRLEREAEREERLTRGSNTRRCAYRL